MLPQDIYKLSLGNQRCATFSFVLITLLTLGCGTTTKRVATEQLLVSNAIDDAVAKIDFSSLSGQRVFLDSTYLKADRAAGFVNTNYVTSSLRQQLTAAGCLIFDSREEADTIVEPRVGAMGTDGHKVTYGIPKTGSLSAAASVFTGSHIGAIPEISFAQSDAQSGIAKVVVFAYDQQTRQPVWQSGLAKAESDSTSTWVLGAGPFQKGSVYDTTRFAGRTLNDVGHGNVLRSGLIRKPASSTTSVTTAETAPRYDSAHLFSAPPIEPAFSKESNDADIIKDAEVKKASF